MTTLATLLDTYCFRLEFHDADQAPVYSQPLTAADFQRAIGSTYFTAFRDGLLPDFSPDWDAPRIEPRFVQDDAARTEGFRVILPLASGEQVRCNFGINYFSARAARQRAAIIRDRDWPADRPLYFTIAAYLDDGAAPPRPSAAFTLEDPSMRVPLRGGSLADWGVREAWDDPQPTSMPVVIGRSLLEDACEEASQHPGDEIGGLILGDLHRDPASGQVCLHLKCLASGDGTTESSKASVTFTPESFAKARELIRLRASQGAPPEIVVGWYHSHPFRFCAECPLPTPPECVKKVLFYSDDDIQLMESTFYQPFMVGLLVAVEPRIEAAVGHLPVRLFGWDNGEIKPRGFEVVND
jgi:proteasome lid subunit RPN8/RPN11